MQYTGYRSLVTGKYYDLNGNESTRYKLSRNNGMILWDDFYADTDSDNGNNVLVLRQNSFGGIERVLNGAGLVGTKRESDNGKFSNEEEDDAEDTFFDRNTPASIIKNAAKKFWGPKPQENNQENSAENTEETQDTNILQNIKNIISNYINYIKENNLDIDKYSFIQNIKQQIYNMYPNLFNNSYE